MPTVDNTKWRGRDVDAEQDAESALSAVCSCVAWSFVPNGSRSACRRCRTRRAARVVGLVEPDPSAARLGLREVAHMSEMRKEAAFLWERHAHEEVGL